MTTCEHAWVPMEGVMAKYMCSRCGATGFIGRAGIQAHRRRLRVPRMYTAQMAQPVRNADVERAAQATTDGERKRRRR
jgi:hypothetical protein